MARYKIYSAISTPALKLFFILSALLLSSVSIADNTLQASLLSQLESLNQASAALVRNARSSRARATPFRIDTALYRENLRSLMLDNQKTDREHTIPKAALINMVRMSALLSSAAECRTGRYIVCPIQLMNKLNSQQQLLVKELTQFKKTAGIN